MGFGNGQKAAVSLGPDGENEGLSGQDGKLPDELAGMRHEQPRLFFTVNHPLVNVEEARDHELDAHLLKHDADADRRSAGERFHHRYQNNMFREVLFTRTSPKHETINDPP